jgi:hypothetical protein
MDAIQDCNVNVLEKIEGQDNFVSTERLSHKLFQIKSSPEYKFAGIDLVSTWVHDQVVMMACKREITQITNFVRISTGVGSMGTIRGSAFEALCHQLLRSGETLVVRELGRQYARGHPIHLPRVEAETFFHDWTAVHKASEGEYLRQYSKGLKAVDALQKPNNLFQTTVAATHPIDATGLSEAIESLDTMGEIHLYLVIPADRLTVSKRSIVFVPSHQELKHQWRWMLEKREKQLKIETCQESSGLLS